MSLKNKKQLLYETVKSLYESSEDLLFHGWHHIAFVYHYSGTFAADLKADIDLTQIAALVHDLNYLEDRGTYSPAKNGATKRRKLLENAQIELNTIYVIEEIIQSAENHGKEISLEAMALSDADTLFKALPVTPILFASRFMTETNYSIKKLSDKIVKDQKQILEQGLYFYSDHAKSRYLKWAKTNVELWENVQESLKDPHIVDMLKTANMWVE